MKTVQPTLTISEAKFWQQVPTVKNLANDHGMLLRPCSRVVRRIAKFALRGEWAYGWWSRHSALILHLRHPEDAPPDSLDTLDWFVPFPVPIRPSSMCRIITDWLDDLDNWPEQNFIQRIPGASVPAFMFTMVREDLPDGSQRKAFAIIRTAWADQNEGAVSCGAL